MKSPNAGLLGEPRPQIVSLPTRVHSLDAAAEAIELADRYRICDGFPLDESQRLTLRAALGEQSNGRWAASTVCDFEPRQNGKNDTINARELAGVFLFGEKLIIHTAHEFATANEAFERLTRIIQAHDDLNRQARIYYGTGTQRVVFKNGARILYKARTAGGTRGFAKADLIVYDEAQHLQSEHLAASGPARLANRNAQAWYSGSGGLSSSRSAWRFRRMALAGKPGRFAYVEHTAEYVDGVLERPDVEDRSAWARANPAYGRRITEEALETAYMELGPDLFARECLCVWEPELDVDERVIPPTVWRAVCDPNVVPADGLVLAVDVNPERSYGSVAVADGSGRCELVQHDPGTAWLVSAVAGIAARWGAPVALDPAGPAGSFKHDIETAGVTVIDVTGREFVQACGSFYDDVFAGKVEVRSNPSLDAAVMVARRRSAGDAWAWTRKDTSVDMSPLVAVTVARWAATHRMVVMSEPWAFFG